jgi:hypothetical protein
MMHVVILLLMALLCLIVGLGYLWFFGPWRPRGRHGASASGYRAPQEVQAWGSGEEGRHIR